GSPWTRVSSDVQFHASARPSRPAATADRESTTPLGAPVVPEVYMIIAALPGSAPACEDDERALAWTGIAGRVTSSGAVPSHTCAPESFRMCARSAGPESGGTGTAATPAMRHPVVAITVSMLAVASMATREEPATSSATAAAAAISSDRVSETSPTRTALRSSPAPDSVSEVSNGTGVVVGIGGALLDVLPDGVAP